MHNAVSQDQLNHGQAASPCSAYHALEVSFTITTHWNSQRQPFHLTHLPPA